MNPATTAVSAKVYEVRNESTHLHIAVHLDGHFVTDIKTGERLVDEGEITKKEFAVLWFMLSETHKRPGRAFTTHELWEGGWPEYRGLPPEHKRVRGSAGNVSKTYSNIRGLLPDVLLKGGYSVKGQVFDTTPPESLFLIWHRIFVACSIAIAVTVGVDPLARAILASFGLTIVQSQQMGFALGFFQGIIGSLVWSVGLAFPLLSFWFFIERFAPWRSRFAWAKGMGIGTLAGLAGGTIISLACLKAQFFQSRVDTGWLQHPQDSIWTAFTVTRVAYSEPWFGAIVGGTLTFTLMWIVSRNEWGKFLDEHEKLTQLSEFWIVVGGLSRMTLRWGSVFIMPAMLVAAVLFREFLPHPLNPQMPPRVFGEALCIGIGGMAFVTGVLIGLYSLTKGVDVAGDRKCALARAANSPASIT